MIKHRSKLLALLFASAVAAASQVRATNIAPDGTAILGLVAGSNDTTSGTPQLNGGISASTAPINDGVLTDRADSFPGPGAGNESFVGITFSTPVNLGLGSNLVLYLNLYVDGGWFGVPGQNAGGPATGTGGTLSASSLVDPHVQYTLNGTTWITLTGVTDNYVTQYTGQQTAVGNPPGTGLQVPATFNLNTALTGVEGIRLTGFAGGSVGNDNDGFLGVQELQVNAVPEPSAGIMMLWLAGGVAAWLGLRRPAAALPPSGAAKLTPGRPLRPDCGGGFCR